MCKPALVQKPTRVLPRLVGAALVAVVGLGALPACSSSDSGELVIYSGRTQDLIEPLLDDFAEQSGTDIAVRYGESADLALLIDEEGDNSPADVFLSQSPGAVGFLDAKKRLTDLPEDILDQVDERFRARDGHWVGISGRVRVIVVQHRPRRSRRAPGVGLRRHRPGVPGSVRRGADERVVPRLRHRDA